MNEQDQGLAIFYKGWDTYQGYLVDAIASLSPEQLNLRAASHLRPVWMLGAHIISARVHWFHRVLGEGSADLAPMIAWDDDENQPRAAGELIHGLELSWQLARGSLERWTPTTLDDRFTTPRGFECTRQWVIWHVIEHDLHHGGELFFTLGMHGLPTPDL